MLEYREGKLQFRAAGAVTLEQVRRTFRFLLGRRFGLAHWVPMGEPERPEKRSAASMALVRKLEEGEEFSVEREDFSVNLSGRERGEGKRLA